MIDVIEKSYAKEFMGKCTQDKFFNLKRTEDASTIFHGELIGGADSDLNYWCEPPAGFMGSTDEYLLVIFGKFASIVLGCKKGADEYRVLLKNGANFPKVLRNGGFEPNTYYPEVDLPDILRLIG